MTPPLIQSHNRDEVRSYCVGQTEDAIEYLLGDRQTGDETADLWACVEEAWERRHLNTMHGGNAIAALVAKGVSYREIEQRLGIPRSTAQRWAVPPDKA